VHFLVFMSVAGFASSQVYKWVDERGVTHYAERPPQGGRATQVPNSAETPAPGPAPSADDYRQKDLEFRQRRIQAEAAEERRREENSRRQEQCNRQRDVLVQLREARRTYTLNESGERIYMDDAGRDAAIARQERIVARSCQS
jgi:hypothetical protein